MSVFFDFLNGKKSKLIIAIDVGSFSIKTAIFEINNSNKPVSSITKRIFYLPISKSEDAELSKVTASRIREIIFNFLKELKRLPDKIIIGLDSPFVEAKIANFKLPQQEKTEKISKKNLESLFSSVIEEENKKIAGEGKTIIWSRPVSTFINGYEVNDLASGAALGEIVFRALASYLNYQKADEILAIPKMLGGIPVEFSSIIFNIGEAVAKKIPNAKECAILDIGGLYTNLIILRNGKISEITGFFSGGYNFTDILSREMGIGAEESLELKKQYAQGIATGQETEKIANIFVGESADWEKKFIESLSGVSATDFFPKLMYIVGGGAKIPEIKNVLEKKMWITYVMAAGDIAVSTIGAEDILGRGEFNAVLKGPEEIGLASLIVNSI